MIWLLTILFVLVLGFGLGLAWSVVTWEEDRGSGMLHIDEVTGPNVTRVAGVLFLVIVLWCIVEHYLWPML